MKKDKHIIISGVSERDIDLLLLEEFISSPEFSDWFIKQIKFDDAYKTKVSDANRGVTHYTGESDLEVQLYNNDQKKFKLLIENKVGAGLQPEQAERYRERGDAYVNNMEIDDYRTVLVAPESYFNNELKGFDARVNYEKIYDWFALNSSLGDRQYYKCSIIKSAIEKGITGYQKIDDEPVTAFWHEYWKLLPNIADNLRMAKPGGKPSKSSFVYFRYNNLPQNIDLVHKLNKGFVDLQFKGMGDKIAEMYDKYGPHLESDMTIEHANKSASIRIHVPKLRLADTFKSQIEDVIKGMKTAERLINWYYKLPDTLKE